MKQSYVLFSGGLGNQMFQYAFLLALRKKGIRAKMDLMPFEWENVHNGFELEKVLGIHEDYVSESVLHKYYFLFLKKYCPKKVIQDYLAYYPQVFNRGIVFYDGFWQWHPYFKDCEKEVRQAFTFKGIDERNSNVAEEMHRETSVSIHFRRGDYLNIPRLMVCDDAYYKNAINYIIEHVDNPVFYVFSNDVEWSREFMKNLHVRFEVMDFNQGKDSYKDMFLMSQCKHNIIANSSFSWWGAWLNKNPDQIVVSPKEWNRRVPEFHPQLDSWKTF